jgi:hypothetical protein
VLNTLDHLTLLHNRTGCPLPDPANAVAREQPTASHQLLVSPTNRTIRERIDVMQHRYV